ncbi:MAG: ABC transporter permease [Syntrophobacteraceae bacterium]
MRWLEKQKHFLAFTLASLLRKKGRNAALVAVYTAVVFLMASVMFFTHSIKQEVRLILQDAPEIVVQRLIAGRHDLIPLTYAEKINDMVGVESVTPRWWGYTHDRRNGANYTIMVGSNAPLKPRQIALGSGAARSLGVKKDDLIPLRTFSGDFLLVRIKEILFRESELVSSDLFLMTERDFKKIFEFPPDHATDLVLRVRDTGEINAIAAEITRLFPDVRLVPRSDILSTYDAMFDWREGMLLAVYSSAIFSFLILAWHKATGLGAEERKEIGILKAIGWETTDVLFLKTWEGIVVSLSSCLMGVLLAYVHVFFASSTLFKAALKGWAVLFPDFQLTPFLNASQIAILFLLTVIPHTVATVLPSLGPATVEPDSVMRT